MTRTEANHRGALELPRPRQSSRRSDWPSGSHTLDVWMPSPAQQLAELPSSSLDSIEVRFLRFPPTRGYIGGPRTLRGVFGVGEHDSGVENPEKRRLFAELVDRHYLTWESMDNMGADGAAPSGGRRRACDGASGPMEGSLDRPRSEEDHGGGAAGVRGPPDRRSGEKCPKRQLAGG